jgi:hypothetical protein
MAQLYTEPDSGVINLTQWGVLIQKTTFEAGGFIALGLTNTNTTGAPQIANGSRVEVGGSLYKCTADETIGGTPETGVNYVYCVPGTTTASFTYSAAAPAWNSVKGGWYNGNNRAVAKFYYTGGQYNGKVVLDSYNAIRAVNTEQSIPTTGGEQEITGAVNQVLSTTLDVGAYRYEIRAGKGGTGGVSKEDLPGGTGADGETKSGTFMLLSPRNIYYALGGDGNNGGVSGGTREEGGGGGCSGGSAFIEFGDKFIFCVGGSGGGGRNGMSAGGGGGGGGYGSGQNIGDPAEGPGAPGNNGIGGKGGKGVGYLGGGGGGGSGGSGGGGGGDAENPDLKGNAGGGYGSSGGSGGVLNKGGVGGDSLKGERSITATNKYPYRIQYQGGGGGGGWNGGGGGQWGDGGSGLKSTSSGYLRIYRMW